MLVILIGLITPLCYFSEIQTGSDDLSTDRNHFSPTAVRYFIFTKHCSVNKRIFVMWTAGGILRPDSQLINSSY